MKWQFSTKQNPPVEELKLSELQGFLCLYKLSLHTQLKIIEVSIKLLLIHFISTEL